MSRKQISRGGLAAPQILAPTAIPPRPRPHLTIDLSGRRELDSQFLRVVSHLKCRPEPRHAWDNRARASQRVPHPAADAIALCHAAWAAAIQSADVDVIRKTKLEIDEYFDRCRAEVYRLPTPTTSHVRPIGAASVIPPLALIKESSDAIVAVATAQAEPTESNFATMRRELREAGETIFGFLGIRLPAARQHVS